jgi:hypothetical protein
VVRGRESNEKTRREWRSREKLAKLGRADEVLFRRGGQDAAKSRDWWQSSGTGTALENAAQQKTLLTLQNTTLSRPPMGRGRKKTRQGKAGKKKGAQDKRATGKRTKYDNPRRS